MDGGSTDGTIEIIEKNSERIAYWRSERDSGIYDAMNKALNYVTGDWVYFLGADDELLDDFSRIAYDLKDSSSIYYGNVLREGIKYLGKVDAYKHAKLTICHQAILYPVSVFKKYKFDISYKISADHVFNMWCWRDKNYHFEYRDYIISNFNHTGISSVKKDPVFERHKASLILKHYGYLVWGRFMIKQMKQAFKKR
jgi:glycosyltransferase involved in cell wall biosynthesis